MVVYSVVSEMGRVDQVQKDQLATGITAIHVEEIGGRRSQVHIIYLAYPRGAAWSAGVPATPVIVSARLRIGRPDEIRARMLQRISDLTCEVFEVSVHDVIVDLSEPCDVSTKTPFEPLGRTS